LSLVFWGVAAGLMFLGAWVYKEYKNYDEIAQARFTLIPATIIMACAVFLFLLGVIGCVGACKEQKCLLALFFTVLLVIFCGLVAGAALAYIYRSEVDGKVSAGLKQGLQGYNNHNESWWKDEMDFMQSKLECCGSESYTDWVSTPWYKSHAATNASVKYPASCCKDNACDYTSSNDTALYEKGCHPRLHDQFVMHLAVIAGTGAAFAIIQILGMVCSCILICKRKSEVPYIGLSEPNAMQA